MINGHRGCLQQSCSLQNVHWKNVLLDVSSRNVLKSRGQVLETQGKKSSQPKKKKIRVRTVPNGTGCFLLTPHPAEEKQPVRPKKILCSLCIAFLLKSFFCTANACHAKANRFSSPPIPLLRETLTPFTFSGVETTRTRMQLQNISRSGDSVHAFFAAVQLSRLLASHSSGWSCNWVRSTVPFSVPKKMWKLALSPWTGSLKILKQSPGQTGIQIFSLSSLAFGLFEWIKKPLREEKN